MIQDTSPPSYNRWESTLLASLILATIGYIALYHSRHIWLTIGLLSLITIAIIPPLCTGPAPVDSSALDNNAVIPHTACSTHEGLEYVTPTKKAPTGC